MKEEFSAQKAKEDLLRDIDYLKREVSDGKDMKGYDLRMAVDPYINVLERPSDRTDGISAYLILCAGIVKDHLSTTEANEIERVIVVSVLDHMAGFINRA